MIIHLDCDIRLIVKATGERAQIPMLDAQGVYERAAGHGLISSTR